MATLNMARSRVRPWIISRVLIAHTCFGRNGGLAPVSLPLFQGVRVRAVKRQLSLSVMILLLGYGAEEHAFPRRWTCGIMSSFQRVAVPDWGSAPQHLDFRTIQARPIDLSAAPVAG